MTQLFIRPCQGDITSPFGMRYHPIFKENRMHWGVDYGNTPKNNTIVASASGKITQAKNMTGYGNVVMIVHTLNGRTYETVYAHLNSISVKVGQTIKQGQSIGVKGTTGNSTGIHLHFEIHEGGRWDNKYTYAKNPLHYIVDEEVKVLQKLLSKAGYKVSEDGIRGDLTDNAIKAFQGKYGLTVDGVVGAITLNKLKAIANAASIIIPSAPSPQNNSSDKGGKRMFNPESPTLHKEMAEFLEKARKSGAFSSTEHEIKAKNKNLELDNAVGLIAAFLNRTIK